ncbi:MAG TPA: ABC transporter ATP-binding protein [Acidimicrobiales bacterium]|nr:ABC transporter ATP-binding protein [Acidimicrobiales bacterium]
MSVSERAVAGGAAEAGLGSGPEPRPDGRRAPVVARARGLRMSYGSREVLRGVELEVRQGEIFAFLGPNGAGKTTTVEILEGYRRPTGGEVEVLGADPFTADRQWRSRVGVVLQSCPPEPLLTVGETLRLYAGFYERPLPVDHVLALAGLTEQAGVRSDRLSGGQQRRLDVALALVGDPELIFLDEPTTGFDPAARRAAWEVISGLRALGKTVFLTTHYLEEADALADRIAVIVGGRIVAEGTPAALGGRDAAACEISFRAAVTSRRSLPAGWRRRARVAAGRVELASAKPLDDLAELAAWSAAEGVEVGDLSVRRPTLEDVYLQLTAGGGEVPA